MLNGSNADELLVVARESGGESDADGISIFLVNPALRYNHSTIHEHRRTEIVRN